MPATTPTIEFEDPLTDREPSSVTLHSLNTQTNSPNSDSPIINTTEATPTQSDDPYAAIRGPSRPEMVHPQPRRKVKWIGLGGDEEPPEKEHLTIEMPPPQDFSDRFHHDHDNNSDGVSTPGLQSAAVTPDSSRPVTPDGYREIPEGETVGLPQSTHHKKPKTFAKEAAKLVALHRIKNAGHREREARDPDMYGSTSDVPRAGGGVLSSLLKLYEQPQSTHSSSATLVSQSGDSTLVQRPPHARLRSWFAAGDPANGADTPPPGTFSLSHASNAFRRAGDRLTAHWDDRPEAAKSKAGVFGALHASAFNLTGAATPRGSTVAPSPSRPGYRLNRTSMPDNLPTLASLSQSPEDSAQQTAENTANNSALHTPALTAPSRAGILSNRNKSSSHLSLATLGDALHPKRYQNESAVYRAAKINSAPNSAPNSPPNEYVDEKKKATKSKKDKRKQDEIFITMHVAAILQRQDFICRLARALMMFGAPSHRLEAQIQATARVLEIDCQAIYIFNFMIISFSDPDTHTSDIKFIKQGTALDLFKLTEIATLHYEVVHDKIGVAEASTEISRLMKAKPSYRGWQQILIGGWCSAMIGIASFGASFIDLLIAFPLGCLLVAAQLFIAARSDILSSIFEIIVAAVASFTAAALAATHKFCFASITSAAIVLILPGWLVCNAALELQSRSIVSGSVRLIWAICYSLFLGFGITIGAEFWVLFSNQNVQSPADNSCGLSHDGLDVPWYRITIPIWFAFLAVPGFSTGLALRNQAKIHTKEFFAMVTISCCGWLVNHFSGKGFPGRSDITSALGSLAVGLLANAWGKVFQGTSFIVAVVPILFQLPSGLANGGLLQYAAATVKSDTQSTSYSTFTSGFSVAEQLITTAIGLTVGLLVASAVFYPFGGSRRGAIMAF